MYLPGIGLPAYYLRRLPLLNRVWQLLTTSMLKAKQTGFNERFRIILLALDRGRLEGRTKQLQIAKIYAL